jgi:hypothetical protein
MTDDKIKEIAAKYQLDAWNICRKFVSIMDDAEHMKKLIAFAREVSEREIEEGMDEVSE